MKTGTLLFTALTVASGAAVYGPAGASPVARWPAGDVLRAQGWQEIARCNDGHTWSYILRRVEATVICRGINARAGPTEYPCREFTGDLETFLDRAAAAARELDAYHQAAKSGALEQFLKARIRQKKVVSCSTDSDRGE